MDLKEIGCEDVDYIDLAQDRVQWQVLCERGNEPSVPLKSRNFLAR
jgi:hypothetical protein